MKISEVLLPCPFCGGKPQIIIAPTNEANGIPCYGIACKECHVMIGTNQAGVTDFYRTPVEAVNVWNRRKDIPIKITVKEKSHEDNMS